MSTEQKSFEDRIAQINKRTKETASKNPKPKTDNVWKRLAYPAAFVGAFMLGSMVVFLTRFIQFQMVGVPEVGKVNTQDFIGIAMASLAGMVISMFLRDKQKEFASASTVGVLLTTFTFHNLVWAYPTHFEQMYSEDWVEFMQKITEPSSLYVFGITIGLS
ncbi:hypothetical protein [Ruegeria sp. A3M17]|uniref:hypothetical protein n=1 Tax=Ruegeria sp. A3M17 TaxID=2267229 RepID=UPI000DEBE3D6|nr:hypothetical protein [Ruegeria sp. A3M17]RBW63448.1 hypothetical protein DS906_00065 [Ruegeria sp. A3M17]